VPNHVYIEEIGLKLVHRVYIALLKGTTMYYHKDAEPNEATDISAEHHLILDGTVNLEDLDDDSIPRVRGLIELFQDFLGD